MSETQPVRWKTRFFTIWSGQAFSLFGSSLVGFALVWWLTQRTGSETVLATGTLVTILPPILLGPFAGAFVDRWSRRVVLIVADCFTALVTAGLILVFHSGAIQPWHLFIAMFLRSLGGAFQSPAMMASTTLLVPKGQLTRVGGMNQTLSGIVRIVAPLAGAFLIGILPMFGVLLVDVVTAALAVGPLFFIAIPQPPGSQSPTIKPSLLRETAEGFRFVWNWRALFFIVAGCTLANICLGPAGSFLPLLVTRDFGGAALQLSAISSAAGFGIVAGGLFMSLWGGFRRKLITSAIGWMGIGGSYVAIAFLPGSQFYALLALMFAIGFMTPVGCAPLDAFYQSCIPPHQQGRVLSVLGSFDGASMPVGLVVAGILGAAVPLRAWYFVVGASHALLGITWLFLRFIRNAEEEATQRSGAFAIAVSDQPANIN